MDEIVAQILKKIEDRQTQSVKITYSDFQSAPSTDIFIDNATVDIMNASLKLIVDMYELNRENEWVKWLAQGFEYDIQFRFEVSEQVSKFIPVRMIQDWPVLFVVDAFRPMYCIRNKHISRQEIAQLPDKSVVVAVQNQRLTSEADDIFRSKDIQLQVRTDEDCIWQK